jgi:hypothetical protein
VDLTLSERKAHVVQSPDPWKRFAYALHFQHIPSLQLILSRRIAHKPIAVRRTGLLRTPHRTCENESQIRKTVTL